MNEKRLAMKVLITGAKGVVGEKLSSYLRTKPTVRLTLLDRVSAEDNSVISADLSKYDAAWVNHFRGQDVIVHLAAASKPSASWSSMVRNNVDAVINVYEAAVAQGVRRLIFASSCRVMLGVASRGDIINHETETLPKEFYGVTKVFGERLGYHYAHQHNLSVICLRIGSIRAGNNRPEEIEYTAQQRWLSNRDLCQAVEKAIFIPNVPFAVLFVTSDNEGMPWDISETIRVLDYRPEDKHRPQRAALKARATRYIRRNLRKIVKRIQD